LPDFGVSADDFVALAGCIFQALAIFDPDFAPVVGDESGSGQQSGGDRHAGAPSAQHVGEELVSEGDEIAAEPVLAHEQPARQPAGLARKDS